MVACRPCATDRAGEASDRLRRIQPGMIVLGIDPGTANTGYGVVARRRGRLVALDGGVITTRPESPPQIRLANIHRRVCELLDEHKVDVLAMEDIYLGRNVTSAFAVGQARGVVMLAAGQRRLQCFSYTPQQVKYAVCGSGRAAKDQVARMVQSLLALESPPRPTTPPTRSRSRSATPTAHRTQRPSQRARSRHRSTTTTTRFA